MAASIDNIASINTTNTNSADKKDSFDTSTISIPVQPVPTSSGNNHGDTKSNVESSGIPLVAENVSVDLSLTTPDVIRYLQGSQKYKALLKEVEWLQFFPNSTLDNKSSAECGNINVYLQSLARFAYHKWLKEIGYLPHSEVFKCFKSDKGFKYNREDKDFKGTDAIFYTHVLLPAVAFAVTNGAVELGENQYAYYRSITTTKVDKLVDLEQLPQMIFWKKASSHPVSKRLFSNDERELATTLIFNVPYDKKSLIEKGLLTTDNDQNAVFVDYRLKTCGNKSDIQSKLSQKVFNNEAIESICVPLLPEFLGEPNALVKLLKLKCTGNELVKFNEYPICVHFDSFTKRLINDFQFLSNSFRKTYHAVLNSMPQVIDAGLEPKKASEVQFASNPNDPSEIFKVYPINIKNAHAFMCTREKETHKPYAAALKCDEYLFDIWDHLIKVSPPQTVNSVFLYEGKDVLSRMMKCRVLKYHHDLYWAYSMSKSKKGLTGSETSSAKEKAPTLTEVMSDNSAVSAVSDSRTYLPSMSLTPSVTVTPPVNSQKSNDDYSWLDDASDNDDDLADVKPRSERADSKSNK